MRVDVVLPSSSALASGCESNASEQKGPELRRVKGASKFCNNVHSISLYLNGS
jgi:hypothetical protein